MAKLWVSLWCNLYSILLALANREKKKNRNPVQRNKKYIHQGHMCAHNERNVQRKKKLETLCREKKVYTSGAHVRTRREKCSSFHEVAFFHVLATLFKSLRYILANKCLKLVDIALTNVGQTKSKSVLKIVLNVLVVLDKEFTDGNDRLTVLLVFLKRWTREEREEHNTYTTVLFFYHDGKKRMRKVSRGAQQTLCYGTDNSAKHSKSRKAENESNRNTCKIHAPTHTNTCVHKTHMICFTLPRGSVKNNMTHVAVRGRGGN